MSEPQLGLAGLLEPDVEVAHDHPFAGLERLPAGVFLGTSSWAFPGWAGLLYGASYEPRLLSRRGLGAYAQQPWLRTVSVDRAFYASVGAPEYAHYAGQVGTGFRFVTKTLQALTEPRIEGARNPEFLDPNLFQTRVINPFLEGLGERAGQILIQFSPVASRLFARHSELFHERLDTLLAGVDPGPAKLVVEVRNRALMNETLVDLLYGHGALCCLTVHPSMAPLADQWRLVERFGPAPLSVRWNLGHGRNYVAAKRAYAPFNRLVAEDPTTRATVVAAVTQALDWHVPVTVVANNKAEGCAPLTLARMAAAVCEQVDP